MANPRAVARALKAKNPAGSPGGYAHPPAVGGFGGGMTGALSPVTASYAQWSGGRAYGSLPRDPMEFLTGAFGPLMPIIPAGVDTPPDGSLLPEPRRWEYPVGWNMPIGVPGTEGLKLADFATLRTLCDSYSVARACIQVRKAEIRGLDWDITPTPDAEKAYRADHELAADFGKRRAEAMAFFRRPDPNYADFGSWLDALLEDTLAVDGIALYLHPSRAKGKGLLGSNLAALDILDPTTIRPLVDLRGGRPMPPNPAYQQYLWGVPRTDLTTVFSGDDVKDMADGLAAEYTTQQLLYLPYVTRSWTPYGFPPLERAIVPAMAGLQRQKWQLDYWQEGSIPAAFISGGDPNSTPEQLRELQDALNAMANDPAWKHKMIVLPGGAHVDQMRPTDLADQFDEIIMTQVCMAYDVMPLELGISPKVSTTQSPGAANQMAKASQDIHERKATKPLLQWLKAAIFDFVLQQVCGQADMQFTWHGMEIDEDESAQVALLINEVTHGLASIDEARVERGRQPWGLPLTSDPTAWLPTGVVPLGSMDPATGKPAATQPENPGLPTPPTPPGGDAPGNGPGKPGQQSPAHSAADSNAAQAESESDDPPTDAAKMAAVEQRKAALGELDLIRRRAGKGRDVSGWQPRHIPQEVLDQLLGDLREGKGVDTAISDARRAVSQQAEQALTKAGRRPHRVARRDRAMRSIQSDVAAGLGRAANQLRAGTLSTLGFVDAAVEVMRVGLTRALFAGAEDALGDKRLPVRLLRKAADPTLANEYDDESPDADVLDDPLEIDEDGGDAFTTADDIAAYLDAQEAAQDAEVGGDFAAQMRSVADREAEDQRTYLLGLAQDLMAATAAAEDWLSSFVGRFDMYGARTLSAYEQGYGLTTLATGEHTITWHTTSSKPCALCDDRDGKTFDEKSLPGWPGDGGFGGLCMGGINCKCYLSFESAEGNMAADVNPLASSGEPETNAALAAQQAQRQDDVAAARAAFVASLPDEVSPELANTSARSRAQARDDARAQLAAEQGVLPQDVSANDVAAQLESQGIPTARSLQAAGLSRHVRADTGKADLAATVHAALAEVYPERVLGWVDDAEWSGPKPVALADIDMERRPGGRDDKKVRGIAAAISDGEPMDPVVLVTTPGGPKLQIADGYHRTLAFRHAGETRISAYVGAVDTDTGPWDRAMHDAKLNKSVKQ